MSSRLLIISPQLGHFCQSPSGNSRRLSELNGGLLKIPISVRNESQKKTSAARHGHDTDGGCACVAQGASAFVHGRTGGKYIVHEDEMAALHKVSVSHAEGVSQVFH